MLFQRNNVQVPIKYLSLGQPGAIRPGSPGNTFRAIRPLRGLQRRPRMESLSETISGAARGDLSYQGEPMKDRAEIRLPWPPSTNELTRPCKVGPAVRLASSRRAKDYRATCHDLLDHMGGPRNIEGPVSVTLTLHPSTARAYDVDNRAKAVLDALTTGGVLWDDDWKTIPELHIHAGRKATREEREELGTRGWVMVLLEALE